MYTVKSAKVHSFHAAASPGETHSGDLNKTLSGHFAANAANARSAELSGPRDLGANAALNFAAVWSCRRRSKPSTGSPTSLTHVSGSALVV